MAKDKSGKKSKKDKSSKKSKSSSKEKARAEKKAERTGGGSFPDILVVTKEKSEGSDKKWFLGHNGETMDTLYKDGETVAIYKLRRVSTVSIKRKVVR